MHDYTPITELPGTLLNDEQMARICQRYRVAKQHAKARRVLEVACGAGMGLGLLAAEATSVAGLDYTQSVLTVAEAHYQDRFPLIRGDAQTLPFADRSFDLLVNFEAIYYLPDPRRFLREAWRVLAPGGTLLLCTSNPDWPHFAPGPLTTRYPTLPELDAWLAQGGFSEREYVGAFPVAAAGGLKQLVAPMRKLILQSGLVHPESALGAFLKRFAYGDLTPLPAELQLVDLARYPAMATLTTLTLPANRTDHTHRVLYAIARRGESIHMSRRDE